MCVLALSTKKQNFVKVNPTFLWSTFIIKSKRCPIEINVSRILNTHIHTHTHTHTHTHPGNSLQRLLFFLSTCIPTPFLWMENSQPKEAVLSHNDSEHDEDLLSQIPCNWDKDTWCGHHQSDKPKSTELTRAPSGNRGATRNRSPWSSRADVGMQCSVPGASGVQAKASNTVQ